MELGLWGYQPGVAAARHVVCVVPLCEVDGRRGGFVCLRGWTTIPAYLEPCVDPYSRGKKSQNLLLATPVAPPPPATRGAAAARALTRADARCSPRVVLSVHASAMRPRMCARGTTVLPHSHAGSQGWAQAGRSPAGRAPMASRKRRGPGRRSRVWPGRPIRVWPSRVCTVRL